MVVYVFLCFMCPACGESTYLHIQEYTSYGDEEDEISIEADMQNSTVFYCECCGRAIELSVNEFIVSE